MIQTITKRFCDRCNKEIIDKYIHVFDTYPATKIEIEKNDDEWEIADICGVCKKEFEKWWKGTEDVH